jgi:hypothetical protein
MGQKAAETFIRIVSALTREGFGSSMILRFVVMGKT